MSYLGSKAASGAYQKIISMMPPHETYIETHLGSGVIMAYKPPAQNNIGIDIDRNSLQYAQSNRLNNYPGKLELHCSCAHEFLSQRFSFTGNELIYSDPPYLLSTRTSKNRYKFEYSDQKHIDLILLLKSLDAQIMLSGYPSELYNDMLSNWNTLSYQVMTRGGVRTEQLWYNYQPNVRFWSSHAGCDFRQRQHIKRKAERWSNNYRKMPPDERRAIMSALMSVDAELSKER